MKVTIEIGTFYGFQHHYLYPERIVLTSIKCSAIFLKLFVIDTRKHINEKFFRRFQEYEKVQGRRERKIPQKRSSGFQITSFWQFLALVYRVLPCMKIIYVEIHKNKNKTKQKTNQFYLQLIYSNEEMFRVNRFQFGFITSSFFTMMEIC